MLLHRVWLILIYTGFGDKNSILSNNDFLYCNTVR